MKVLVIDNEPNLRTAIKALLNAFCPEITNIEEAEGVQSGLHKIKKINPTYYYWMWRWMMVPVLI
jgi:DNA-binding NarL/FixJ family response regulator